MVKIMVQNNVSEKENLYRNIFEKQKKKILTRRQELRYNIDVVMLYPS